MDLTKKDGDLGFYTRESDGASGMTITALAELAGTGKNSITKLLDEISNSDGFVNKLPESLKPFAGKALKGFVNRPNEGAFIADDVCQAVLEYYAFEARQYKGKDVAIQNYRTIARAGMRVYIWSQTGYDPNKKLAIASFLSWLLGRAAICIH